MKNILLRKLEKENISEKQVYFYNIKGGKLYIENKEKNNILLNDIIAIYIKDYIFNLLVNSEHMKNEQYYLKYDFTKEKLFFKKDKTEDFKSIDFDLKNYEFKNINNIVIDLWMIPIFIRIKYNDYFPISPKYIHLLDNKLNSENEFSIYKCNTKIKSIKEFSLEFKLFKQSKEIGEKIYKDINLEKEFIIKDDRFILLIKKEINKIRNIKPMLISDFSYTYQKNDKYKNFLANKGIENPYINLDNPNIYSITYINKIIKEN